MVRDVPILLIAFRRPELTAQVVRAIGAQRPGRLYVAMDGARPQVEGEADLVRRTRQVVETGVDWPCRLEWQLQPRNLGCRRGVVAALDWFFEQVSEGIVLEDDILPDPSFFPYCAQLLQRYRQDPRVGGSPEPRRAGLAGHRRPVTASPASCRCGAGPPGGGPGGAMMPTCGNGSGCGSLPGWRNWGGPFRPQHAGSARSGGGGHL